MLCFLSPTKYKQYTRIHEVIKGLAMYSESFSNTVALQGVRLTGQLVF